MKRHRSSLASVTNGEAHPIIPHRISYAAIGAATATLFICILHTPRTCVDLTAPNPDPHSRFLTSTCDHTDLRPHAPKDKLNRRIWSTRAWISAVDSYASLFRSINVSNHTHVLVVSAGAGQPIMALQGMGVEDVTGIEVVESPPLVNKADPHNLPFFDGVFDVGLGAFLERALFPRRYVGELERTVPSGGLCVVTVEGCDDGEVKEVVDLFRRSSFVEKRTLFLGGERRMVIVMRVGKSSSSL